MRTFFSFYSKFQGRVKKYLKGNRFRIRLSFLWLLPVFSLINLLFFTIRCTSLTLFPSPLNYSKRGYFLLRLLYLTESPNKILLYWGMHVLRILLRTAYHLWVIYNSWFFIFILGFEGLFSLVENQFLWGLIGTVDSTAGTTQPPQSQFVWSNTGEGAIGGNPKEDVP